MSSQLGLATPSRVIARSLLALAFTASVGALAPTEAIARDRDRDGLSNRFERKRSHTKVRKADTDRDGLKDGAEIKRYKTSPHRRDTDRDGLRDGPEVKRYKTSPRRRDTDGDGLSDGAEVKRYKTSPLKRDTDGDGISDRDEVRRRRAPKPPSSPTCSSVVASLSGVQSAVAAAAPGAVVCLAEGSYGRLSLSASKAGAVVVRAEHAGRASIAGASLSGRWLTLARFNVTSEVVVERGAEHMSVEFNRISGGDFGVNAGPSDDVYISDTRIVGNSFQGNFNGDALRVNRYHDGDGDGVGILIEGNEITGVRESGDHNDCLQSVWGGDHLVFRRNYLHDNRCQGFFIKDHPQQIDRVVFDNNLIVRNDAACDPSYPGCGQPVAHSFSFVASYTANRNTVWSPGGGLYAIRGASGASNGIGLTNNVIHRPWSDTAQPFASGYSAVNNLRCSSDNGTFPKAGFEANCSPAFTDPGSDDYRIVGSSRGVDWRPADQHYGP